MAPPEELLLLAAEVFDECRLESAVIGGCARNVYAPPRGTKDADFAVGLDDSQLAALLAAFRRRGFLPATTVTADSSDSLPDLILFKDSHGDRIDVLIAKTEFERSALARREVLPGFGQGKLSIVTVEDLLIYKLLAGRPRDLADAEEVARTQTRAGRAIDFAYVERHCADWDVEDRLVSLKARLI